MDSVLLLTRPGFEAEAIAEIKTRGEAAGIYGFAKTVAGSGRVLWQSTYGDIEALSDLIFARRKLAVLGVFSQLNPDDRVSPLLELLATEGQWCGCEMLAADTNEGRSLSRFMRRFKPHFAAALKRCDKLHATAARRLVIVWMDSVEGYLCEDLPGRSLPRLKLLADAPSRSALKLEEACLRFFSQDERTYWLSPGRKAVDLGAAPGGWSWYLAKQGIKVTSVDHANMDAGLLANYPVQHLSADAYLYHPPRPVDWVVCDVVEKPARTAFLMLKWLQKGWAKAAIFNLKLPMKKRFQTIWGLLQMLEAKLAAEGAYRLQAHQLYHDREEITVLIRPDETAR